MNHPYFWKNLDFLNSNGQELIVIDGGSDDGTCERLEAISQIYKVYKNSTRGERFNEAIKYAHGKIAIFVHPRSLIPHDSIEQLQHLSPHERWGAFSHEFDLKHPVLNFTSWWSNYIRGDIKGIYYLDHILWANMDLIRKIGGFPTESIFEDTIFCQKLLKISTPKRLSAKTITSSIRFLRNGIWNQSLLNQLSKLKFHLGIHSDSIDEIYEEGMVLNRSRSEITQNDSNSRLK